MAKSLNLFLTILSSREWKVIIAILPPLFSLLTPSSIALFRIDNSLFTSILIAWKVLFAGCGHSLLAFAGIASFIISTSSNVVSIFFSLLLVTIKSVSYTHLDVYKRQALLLLLKE